jgi:hypothetical protein
LVLVTRAAASLACGVSECSSGLAERSVRPPSVDGEDSVEATVGGDGPGSEEDGEEKRCKRTIEFSRLSDAAAVVGVPGAGV